MPSHHHHTFHPKMVCGSSCAVSLPVHMRVKPGKTASGDRKCPFRTSKENPLAIQGELKALCYHPNQRHTFGYNTFEKIPDPSHGKRIRFSEDIGLKNKCCQLYFLRTKKKNVFNSFRNWDMLKRITLSILDRKYHSSVLSDRYCYRYSEKKVGIFGRWVFFLNITNNNVLILNKNTNILTFYFLATYMLDCASFFYWFL